MHSRTSTKMRRQAARPRLLQTFRRNLETGVIKLHGELDLVAADLALVRESAERPVCRKRNRVCAHFAVLDWRLILGAGDRPRHSVAVNFDRDGVDPLRSVRSSELRRTVAPHVR